MSEIVPKKELGQHWLFDDGSLDAMCKSAEVCSDDFIVEVGPGLGSLTAKLLDSGARVLAIEYDEILAKNLRKHLKSEFGATDESLERLEIKSEDIVKFDFTKLPSAYKVVANIPYYLTSKLVRILCESQNPPSNATILVQKEVAERVCAKPGSTSVLSISAQVYSDCILGKLVPAELFVPAPKVDSQILIMKRLPEPLVSKVIEKIFFSVVKAGFSERRKKLRSSLSGGLRITKIEADELLKKAGINPTARAQELSIDEWLTLTAIFSSS